MSGETLHLGLYSQPSDLNHREAQWLSSILRQPPFDQSAGSASIYANSRFHGQWKAEIDLFLQVRFSPAPTFHIRTGFVVSMLDFLAVVEVKGHTGIGPDGQPNIDFHAGKAYVRYWDSINHTYQPWQNVSQDSDKQYMAVRDFIKNQLGWEPYICNLILFPNRTKADLPPGPHNFLAGDSTPHQFLERLCISRRLEPNGVQPVSFSCYCRHNPCNAEQRHRELSSLLHYNPPPMQDPVRVTSASPPPASGGTTAASVDAAVRPPVRRPTALRTVALRAASVSVRLAADLVRRAPRLAAALLLLAAFASVPLAVYRHSAHRTFSENRPGSSSSPSEELRLCSKSGASDRCRFGSTIRTDSTLEVQLSALYPMAQSVTLRNPKGLVTTLPIAAATPASTAAPLSYRTVARLTVGHHRSALGIYTVTVRVQTPPGSSPTIRTFTQDFIVAR